MRELGKIAKLWRYPVKSMLGEPCGRIELGPHGVLGDRNFAVRAADGKLGSGKSTHRFRIGDSVVLRISEPTERCAMTTFAQSDLPADARVLKCLARDADLRFGVYAEVLAAGSIACGDRVSFEIGL